MRKQKTIFDLFREKDSQFAAEPSNDAWSKLEQKLDHQNPTSGRVVRFSMLSIAAGMLLLVGLTGFLFVWLSQSAQGDLTASAESSTEFYMEELEFSERNENEWNATEEYRARFANYAIKESKDAYKELAIRNFDKKIKKVNVNPGALHPEIKNEIQHEKKIAKAKKREEKMVDEGMAKTPKSENSIANRRLEEMTRNTIVTEGTYMDFDAAESIQEQSIKGLTWLVGNWEAQKGTQKSVEKWVADSSNTISGTGYLVQEDDTVFTEQMVIKQIGEKIYLFQNIESASHKVPFELVAQADTQWIFENADVAHPNQIILSNGGPSNYQMKMKNLIPINTDYLKQRNHYKSNAALRQMRRVN